MAQLRQENASIRRILHLDHTDPENHGISCRRRENLQNWVDRYEEVLNPGSYARQPGIKKSRCYISVYAVTRHYGGPEEGGWYYNFYRRIFSSRRIKWHKASKVQRRLARHFYALAWGNIYSAAGGLDITLLQEQFPGENETRATPVYS